MMASVSEEDLAEVMRDALERSGDLAMLRIQLEENAVALRNKLPGISPGGDKVNSTKPVMPSSVFLVNELIREYFSLTGCRKAASVLTTESGLPAEPMSSSLLRKTLSSGRNFDKKEPLLCTIVDHLLKEQ